MPIACLGLLLALVIVVNPVLTLYKPGWVLKNHELVMIFVMTCISGAFGASSLWRYLPSFIAGAAYYTTDYNGFSDNLLAHLPDWALVSKDPQHPAIRGFFEGLSVGDPVPWMAWLEPMLKWSIYLGGMYVAMLSLSVLFSKQWIERERLSFPLTYLPFRLAEDPEKGTLWNSFLRNPIVWVGAGIPLLVWGFNGLGVYIPGLPQITTSWPTFGIFQDRPWNALYLFNATIFFSAIGITFLLPVEVSLSIWLFFVLFRLSFVGISAIGAPPTGFFGNWHLKVQAFQSTGVFLVIAAFTFYVARRHLAAVLRTAWKSESNDSGFNPLGARLVLAGTILGPTVMFFWLIGAGVKWPFSLIGCVIFISILLVLTRLIAEAGLMFIGTESNALDFLMGLFTPKELGGSTVAQFAMQRGIVMHDYKEAVMPFLANGLKLGSLAKIRFSRMVIAIALSMVVGYIFGGIGILGTSYKYGMANMEEWGSRGAPNLYLAHGANFNKAEAPPAPFKHNAAHLAIGVVGAALLLFLRSRLPWWPLHPYGWVLCQAYAINTMWFSIFLGWLAKILVIRFGGPRVYRKVLPAFMGLVLGEAMIAGFWAAISLVLGTPGIRILPE